MKPYPAYKESGIEWIGKIPEHWGCHRMKTAVSSSVNGVWGNEEQGDENDVICIRVADFDMATLGVDTENLTIRNISENQQNGRIFHFGDLLIEKSGGGENQPVGRMIRFDLQNGKPAVCSNFVGKLSIRDSFNPNYFLYYAYNLYAKNVNTRSIKQTTGIQNLDLDSYLNELMPVPPIEEQQAITVYLDRKTAVIDTLIAKKEQQIALLQEQKTAVINHAVTKGLNPHAPRKDSDIPWLGQIPAHWEVAPLKFVTEIQTGLTLGNRYDNEETTTRPYLRVANVQDGYLDLETITTIEIPVDKVERYELQFGDVLMTEGGDFDKLGRGFIWEGQIEGCLHQNHVFAVRPNQEKILPHFLAALTTSLHGKNYFTRTSQQTTNLATINKTKLGQFPLLLPPVEEQQNILRHIQEKTTKLDHAIENVQTLIEKFVEYRTAVISAAVTGKIDVRGNQVTGTSEVPVTSQP